MSDQQPLADLRITYAKGTLRRADLTDEPLALFRQWLADAVLADILEPNAMMLATVEPDGSPSARMVLLKGLDTGFHFFTNYDSQKGRALAANPQAALVFYWDLLHRQVRITGRVERLSAGESAEYFHSRPRGSRIGAWTSPQSQMIANRDALEALREAQEARFAGSDDIPVPPFWGGYRLTPQQIEFWQGRPSRLHDRFRYTRDSSADGGWKTERLAP